MRKSCDPTRRKCSERKKAERGGCFSFLPSSLSISACGYTIISLKTLVPVPRPDLTCPQEPPLLNESPPTAQVLGPGMASQKRKMVTTLQNTSEDMFIY